MTPPLDLLTLAATRRHTAYSAWLATRHMQASSQASIVAARARADLSAADRDYKAVLVLIADLDRRRS
jgi:hypothetical protein